MKIMIDFCLFLLGHSVTHDSNGKSIKKDRFATPATADTNLTAKMNSRKSNNANFIIYTKDLKKRKSRPAEDWLTKRFLPILNCSYIKACQWWNYCQIHQELWLWSCDKIIILYDVGSIYFNEPNLSRVRLVPFCSVPKTAPIKWCPLKWWTNEQNLTICSSEPKGN